MGNRPRTKILSQEEISRPFIGDWAVRFPPILSVDKLGELLGISTKTLYEWIAKGRLDGSYRKRGKWLLFWRDKVIDLIFNGEEW